MRQNCRAFQRQLVFIQKIVRPLAHVDNGDDEDEDEENEEEERKKAARRKIKLVILPTKEAIKKLKQAPAETNAILHVTC